jgi:putative methyltransferase (TIGR04325 family)
MYHVPGVPALRRRRHVRHFLSREGFTSHLGYYASFAEARRSLPPSAEFDDVALADEYVRVRTGRIFAYDYPVLFWLDRALRAGAAEVADIGGSVGVHYHAYARWLDYPAELRWTVLDVPAITCLGERIARERGATQLAFTTRLDADFLDADVWIASGSLQYIEDATPTQLLSMASRAPDHVLLNKLPLHDGATFVTAQNIGPGAYAPVYVFNRDDLVAPFVEAGYELVDSWEVPQRDFHLPDHEEEDFECFSGLYLRRRGAARGALKEGERP